MKTCKLLPRNSGLICRKRPEPTLDDTKTNMMDDVSSPLQNLRVKLTVLDFDRHTKTTRLGSAAVTLKDVKNLAAADGEKIIMTTNLAQKKEVKEVA